MTAPLDLTNKRYDRLTVMRFAGRIAQGQVQKRAWLCRCECGKEVTVTAEHLQSGHTTSCGCSQREKSRQVNTIHGMHGTPEYKVWKGMWSRCTLKSASSYRHYGGKGIRVCDRWKDFALFVQDMGPRPSDRHSIEREKAGRNYEPGNCRWATAKEQASNTSRNVFVTVGGDKVTLAEACRRLGLTYKQARRQLCGVEKLVISRRS